MIIACVGVGLRFSAQRISGGQVSARRNRAKSFASQLPITFKYVEPLTENRSDCRHIQMEQANHCSKKSLYFSVEGGEDEDGGGA